MKLQTKFNLKRYYIYAKRNESEKWMDWTQTDDLDRAMEHVKTINNCGFLAKVCDRENKRVVLIDG